MTKLFSFTLLFLLSAGCLFAQGQGEQGEVVDRIIGVVGNEIILQSDLENDLVQRKMRGEDPDGDTRCGVIEDLLFQKLLLNQARFDSLVVSEGEIQSKIEARLDYFLNMFGSIEAMEKEYGKSIAQWKAEFHDPIEEQLLIQQMQYQLESRTTATPRDVQQFFESIPSDSLPLISEEVRYSQIVLQPEATQQEKERLRQQADSVRSLVASGKLSMTIAALRYSDDPGSKYKGGCYEGVRRGMFVPEFEAAVFNTDEGDVSPVFESSFGYHFLKVTTKQSDTFGACHVLFSPKVKDDDLLRTEALLDSLSEAIQNDSLSFEKAAIRYSTDEETRNQSGRVPNFLAGGMKHSVDDLERDIFLVLDKLEPGEISQPIMRETPGGTPYFVLFKLDERIAAHQANLRDDYVLFKEQAEAEMRQEGLEKWVRKKLQDTYIRLIDEYQSCTFTFPWLDNKL